MSVRPSDICIVERNCDDVKETNCINKMDSELAKASLQESTHKIKSQRENSKSKRRRRSDSVEEDVPTHDEGEGTDQLPKSKRLRPQFLLSEEISPRSAKVLNAREVKEGNLISLWCYSGISRVLERESRAGEEADKQQAPYPEYFFQSAETSAALRDQLFKLKTFVLRGGTQGGERSTTRSN